MRSRSAIVLAAALVAAAASVASPLKYRNVTAGGELRAGVYGRIDPGDGRPPPVVYKQPVVAAGVLLPPGTQPVYLYVPSGQVRKWDRHCIKWRACELPVYFVRVDDNPGKLGSWYALRSD
ncbi:hypothetical protein [Ramlibacter albus]|uniref:Uncharacterized protein n=1 Tax=Ramlibacter albus TaxID=2079448 RepID=A0A923M9T5_9BURK|nr:hypothetical protein [Ramlibacter albus]MBC5766000.1 hypothetical protein [Ramlibacter albus]